MILSPVVRAEHLEAAVQSLLWDGKRQQLLQVHAVCPLEVVRGLCLVLGGAAHSAPAQHSPGRRVLLGRWRWLRWPGCKVFRIQMKAGLQLLHLVIGCLQFAAACHFFIRGGEKGGK